MLYLVPTPIGNLEDITLRALRILKEVDLILAEDTRTTGNLLKHFEIKTPLFPHHQHNEHQTVEMIVSRINSGQKIALVSDAGTPGISDPGFLLVRECVKAGVKVECLPGPTAFVPALVQSGLPCDSFVFVGFLPQKKGRQTKWKELAEEKRTMVLYESPFRLVKALEEMKEHFGAGRQVCVSRELTKMFEENFRGTVEEAIKHFSAKTVKGEIVIVVAGNDQ
ncbi:MAG TPA: 16S rRNA (cytidine(1402)-2'-O)-methyltransferase [Bacteroidia bacterium]|jgi:16S rRNA (cytidine1402-2'-O)-methyltransferase|nr:16S rRNA (cytidine(1402)-2'-O)-methyltransferase [Bacteroidia bacterium]